MDKPAARAGLDEARGAGADQEDQANFYAAQLRAAGEEA